MRKGRALIGGGGRLPLLRHRPRRDGVHPLHATLRALTFDGNVRDVFVLLHVFVLFEKYVVHRRSRRSTPLYSPTPSHT